MNKAIFKKTADFFGLNSTIVSMLLMLIFVGIGDKMADRFLPLYLYNIGGSVLMIGILSGMQNFLGALYSLPGGYFSDKIGYKRTLILFTVIAIFGYILVTIFPNWLAVLIGVVFFIAWSTITLPAMMSIIAKSLQKSKQTMGVSVLVLIQRILVPLGPVLGGLLIGIYGMVTGMRIAFAVAALLSLAAIILIAFLMREDNETKPVGTKLFGMFKNIGPNLRNLLFSDILIRFADQIPYAFVVIWVVNRNGLSPLQFGILTTIEMLVSISVYIPVAHFGAKYAKKPFIVTTFIFFSLFPLVLAFSRTFPALVVAFVIRGLKEIGEPTRKALILEMAPEGAKAGTFGAYYFIRNIVVSVAAFGSAYLWNISPRTNFMTAFAFGVLGTIIFAIWGRDLSTNCPSSERSPQA